MKSIHRIIPLLLVVAFHAACGDDDPSGPSDGITVVAGGMRTDTIGAQPSQALVVEVGGASEGTIVRFNSLIVVGPCWFDPQFECPVETVLVGATDAPGYNGFVAVEANARGRAAATLRFGPTAGQGGVIVTVPELGLVDTVFYTILPGDPAQILVAHGAGFLVVGETDSLGARVIDRGGNFLDEPIAFASLTPQTIGVTGGSVVGLAPGSGRVRLEAGELADTVDVPVLPDARITITAGGGFSTRILSMRLDGADTVVVTSLTDFTGGPIQDPFDDRWIHYRREDQNTDQDWGLYEVRPGQAAQELALPATLAWAAWPRFSPDGQSIWFEGRRDYTGCVGVWRLDRDGTVMDSVRTQGASSLRLPQVSPDGTHFAALRGGCSGNPAEGPVRIYDLVSGGFVEIAGTHDDVAWSPDSDEVAVARNGEIYIHSAVTGAQLRGPFTGSSSLGGIDWSPDSEWIAITGYDGLRLVSAETGVVLDTPIDQAREPDWQ